MASVNVNRNLSDQFYRYKMPKLVAKVEGKGNGIKTVIVNMVDIAKALNRPPMYPTKYFGCVLGAQVNCDVKNERYIVNGAHEASKLQEYLDGFIRKYVLCVACDNPETVLSVNQKKGTITSTCKACGHSQLINSQDKLTTYILKCPPDQSNAPGASVSKRKKKEKENASNKATTSGSNGRGGGSPQPDSDEFPSQQQNGDQEQDNDGDWCDPDLDPDDLSGSALQKLTLNSDLDRTVEERMQMFYDFVKKKLSNGQQPTTIDVQKEILAEAERLDIRDKGVIVLCEILFREPNKIFENIKQHRTLFLRFTLENPKCQRYLIRGIEMTIKEFPNELLPRVPIILKKFYDEDILDEKVLLEWDEKKKSAAKQLANQIFANASPFIKWLKEAEEEDDDDDDEDGNGKNGEDEDLTVVYDERSRPDKIIEIEQQDDDNEEQDDANRAKRLNSKFVQNNNQKEVDIDIDAI